MPEPLTYGGPDTADILSRLVDATPVADIVVLHPEAPRPPASIVVGRESRRPRPRWLVPGLIAVLAGVTVAAGVRVDMGARHDLQKARDQVAIVRSDLRTANGVVSATTAERDRLKAALDARTAELDGAKGSLESARSQLNLQAGQLDTIRTCLHGITDAMVIAAQGDEGRAMARLDAVQGACDKSDEILR